MKRRLFANSKTAPAEPGFANQISVEDGAKAPEWVEIPFGNHDHKNGLQVFDRESAEQIVANFQSLTGKRTFGGLPWYVGHPDVPEFANSYKDKSARGWVKEMEVRETGLALRVKWNAAGEQIIANEEFKYFSPVWSAQPVPGKSKQFRPVRMKSVGFTNEPNIGVLPLSNANEATNETTMKLPPWLATLLGVSEDATDEQCLQAIQSAGEKAELANEASVSGFWDWLKKSLTAAADPSAPNSSTSYMVMDLYRTWKSQAELEQLRSTLANERTDLETALANEKTSRETAEAERNDHQTAFANERKARIELLLGNAIRDGRITEAQREPWANELSTHFDTKSAELAALKPAIHTSAHTKNLGTRKLASPAASKAIELANERMTKTGEDWTTAWRTTLKDHPDLDTELKQQPANA